MIDECALDVDLGRPVCIGWMFASDTEPRVLVCENEAEERFALEQVARDYAAVTNPQLVTFSGLRFDLPFLMRRALYLGVRFPIWNLDRYKTPHLDLQAYLSHNGLLKWRSLKFYLNRFGIASDDMTTGAEIGAMVKAGDWAGVKAHCAADVLGTKKLAQRLGLIKVTQPAVAEGVF
jgi:predicted PolB exonuclease-like 3'-5' exonuclease